MTQGWGTIAVSTSPYYTFSTFRSKKTRRVTFFRKLQLPGAPSGTTTTTGIFWELRLSFKRRERISLFAMQRASLKSRDFSYIRSTMQSEGPRAASSLGRSPCLPGLHFLILRPHFRACWRTEKVGVAPRCKGLQISLGQ